MSWEPELYIGGMRPWPDAVRVVRSQTDESMTYVPERTCKNISNPPSGFLCSECGWGDFAEPSHLLTTAKYANNDGGPNYCPNCRRKVER